MTRLKLNDELNKFIISDFNAEAHSTETLERLLVLCRTTYNTGVEFLIDDVSGYDFCDDNEIAFKILCYKNHYEDQTPHVTIYLNNDGGCYISTWGLENDTLDDGLPATISKDEPFDEKFCKRLNNIIIKECHIGCQD